MDINRASVKIDSNSHNQRHMRRSTASNPSPTWVSPYLSFDGQLLFTPMTHLPSNWAPCHVCRQAGENITQKEHWGASLGLEVRWPESCWASLYTPYEWCMAGWRVARCGERERVRDSSHRSKWALIKGATITLTSASSFQWVPPGAEEMALAGWKGLDVCVCVC